MKLLTEMKFSSSVFLVRSIALLVGYWTELCLAALFSCDALLLLLGSGLEDKILKLILDGAKGCLIC
jgi:hypothetical protein